MKKILITGGAGFIGANLTLELQKRYPLASLTVIDDFRSGNFKNLQTYKGDFIAANLADFDWKARFKTPKWDAIFHLASITDTTQHDQKLQVRDNVESFRNLLEFTQKSQTPIIYASSAATYGIRSGVNQETDPLAPANVYAFSKMIMENLAHRAVEQHPKWQITGLRYFNVYGTREAHKGLPSSMIYHLAQQIHSGKHPRLFKFGEQQRDFVYVNDVVAYTIAALLRKTKSPVLNIGTGAPRSFNDIVTILNKLLKTKLEPDYFDNPYPFYQTHTQADMQHTNTQLGVTSQYTLEQGIQDYLDSGFLLT